MSSGPRLPSLLIGTRNAGKLREIEAILDDIPWRIRSLNEFASVGVAAETANTYAGNAIAKARFYAHETGLCSLADDSGLEVEILGGAPGVFSARYAGGGASDADRRALLLSELATVPIEGRRARFICVVAIGTPDGRVLNTSEGICDGTIAFAPRGESGFGYDPLFLPEGFEQTFAELSDTVKNRISHRARALLKTREFLTSKARECLASQAALLDRLTSGS
jgi:XTP/dITP diphosphohydrolase